jgi:quinol monooxygenase YgiN
MRVTLVHVYVKPGNVGEFIDATLGKARNSVLEPGNVRFDMFQLKMRPRTRPPLTT